MAAKVYIVNYAHESDHKVFFCDYDHEQKNHQIISGGKLVKYALEADVKVFIVNYAHEASIKIRRNNFPK